MFSVARPGHRARGRMVGAYIFGQSITWTRAQTEARAKQNPGSIVLYATTGGPLLNKQGRILRVMNLADARVDKKKAVVICSTVPDDQPPYYNDTTHRRLRLLLCRLPRGEGRRVQAAGRGGLP